MKSLERTCAYHESVPAIAVCSGCGGDICGACHGSDLRGFARCTDCRGEAINLRVPWESFPPGPGLKGFFLTIWLALTSPRTFFFRLNPAMPRWGQAATFGIFCVALGTMFQTLWQKAFSSDYEAAVARYVEEIGTSQAMAEFAIFASIPFGAVVLYFVHTALLYCALRMFGVTDAAWSLVARISGYSLAAYVLLIFPPLGDFSLGHFLMVVWLFNLEVSAVRWFFNLGFWKSMGVVLVPLMLFLMIIG